MNYQHPALQTYSDNGMRSAEEWLRRGRNIIEGSDPRTRVMAGNSEVPLFTRDQTQKQPASTRSHPGKIGASALPGAPLVPVI
jgi:hypothetical protein